MKDSLSTFFETIGQIILFPLGVLEFIFLFLIITPIWLFSIIGEKWYDEI